MIFGNYCNYGHGFVSNFVPTWTQVGPMLASKINQKSVLGVQTPPLGPQEPLKPDFVSNLVSTWTQVCSNMLPKWTQNDPNVAPKWRPIQWVQFNESSSMSPIQWVQFNESNKSRCLGSLPPGCNFFFPLNNECCKGPLCFSLNYECCKGPLCFFLRTGMCIARSKIGGPE